MTQHAPAWPHGELREIFPNVFFVTGTNFTTHEGMELQHSLNMVIVKNGNELTLINTVRLNDKGLAVLISLERSLMWLELAPFMVDMMHFILISTQRSCGL